MNFREKKCLLLTLVGHSFLELLDFFGIAEEVVLHEVEVVVKLEDVGKCRGKIEADDVLVADAFEVLDDTAEAVAVSHNEEVVYLLEGGENHCRPVGEGTSDAVLQAFGAGQFGVGHFSVAGFVLGIAFLVVFGNGIGSDVEAATPNKHLLFAVLGSGFALVQALEHTVVLLVQAPALLHGNPILVHHVQHVVERLDGTLEVGSVGHAKLKSGIFEGLTGFAGFAHTFFSEVYIGPTGEAVFEIPLALSVTEQNNSFHV